MPLDAFFIYATLPELYMTITEVTNKASKKAFLDVARIIYKNDDVWVCPLDNDIEAVFDPAKNNFHQHGKATRWILRNEKGELTGRIAAFINNEKAWNYEQPTGGVGFFEDLGFIGQDPYLIKGVYRDISGAKLCLGFSIYPAPKFFT